MTKKGTCGRVTEWYTPSCTGGEVAAEQRGEDSEKFKNLYTLKCILMTEKCFIGGYCTVYFNKSSFKIWSFQDEFL